MPAEPAADVVRQRRRLMPTAGEPDGPEPLSAEAASASSDRLVELQSSLEAAKTAARRHRENLDVLQAETAALRERTVELRERRHRHVAELRAAAERRREN